jgi:hypothetical protein
MFPEKSAHQTGARDEREVERGQQARWCGTDRRDRLCVDGVREFLNGRGTFELQKAIDQHVVDTIVAANPQVVSAGGDDWVSEFRTAIGVARSHGANPMLTALDPLQSATLDLTTQPGSGGDYLFPLRATGQRRSALGSHAGRSGEHVVQPAHHRSEHARHSVLGFGGTRGGPVRGVRAGTTS